MMELVDGAADRVHNLAMELRPDVLDRLGLPEAVEWQARQFEQRTGIATQFETNVTETVEPRRATALFRIAQEALTNVARHADAHRVRVSLTIRGGDLALEVSDDGRGLAPGRGRLGLLGMRERALALGGDVAIVGPPGRGTVVTARLPLTDTTS
jgi:signal transduction histidine kinase